MFSSIVKPPAAEIRDAGKDTGKDAGKAQKYSTTKPVEKKKERWVNQFAALSVDEFGVEVEGLKEEEPEPNAVERNSEWDDVDIMIDMEWFMIRCFLFDLDIIMRHVIVAWDEFRANTVTFRSDRNHEPGRYPGDQTFQHAST
ncbi:hypothetical protein HDU96_005366 [Phlyctochytrium bullatum]|nr:hypothetical protein HDU96_005366 [Phlyctochytrium bullatum]